VKILLAQLDGKMSNIALMRIAAHHRAKGDEVELRQFRRIEGIGRELWDDWDLVYGSLIFTRTQPLARRLAEVFPGARIGGTGWNLKSLEAAGITTKRQDYSVYPNCRQSIGFSQRGCRLDCWFCDVHKKEGDNHEEQTVAEIWRGDPWPREVLLLDNDFFGQPRWRDRIEELLAGKFKVSFNQGINCRLLSDEQAAAIASVDYRADDMKERRVYTAWDNADDERTFFRGMRLLTKHGVRPDDILVYMLIGAGEDHANRERRRRLLREFGARPYPMPYTRTDETRGFQRWVVRRADLMVPWEEFQAANYRPEKVGLN
jgi:hypothetical protein